MKYKHIKSGIVVRQNLSGHYIDECNSMKLPAIMVENTNDWEKVVEVPKEVKDKLLQFYGTYRMRKIGNCDMSLLTEQQFKDYFGI